MDGDKQAKFPRYFTHVDGFSGCAAYILIINSQSSVTVCKDGHHIDSYGWSLLLCERYKGYGLMKEITRDEANELLTTSELKEVCV